MRALVLELDSLPSLREATDAADVDLTAAATLAELAGVDAVRLGLSPDGKPVREEDVRDTRRAARRLELRMAPGQELVRLALDVQPHAVLLAAEGSEGRSAAHPLDLRQGADGLGAVVRALREAGMGVAMLVSPALESVKAAHAAGASGIEIYTGSIVDLPAPQRRAELQPLGDAARLGAKLGLEVGLGGGLGYRSLPEVLAACGAAERVAVGRAALTRALLVGLDRALRDLRALL